MQTPAPRPAPNDRPRDAPDNAGDRTVLLTNRAIRQAAQGARQTPGRVPPFPPGPGYPPRPYPPVEPAGSVRTTDRNAGQGVDADADATPAFALTSTQVIASMSAAVVAAFIGAQLGVAGTIVGAAIASVVSVVGSAVIGHSLLLTRRKVTRTVQHVRAGTGSSTDDGDTVLLTAVTRQVEVQHAAPTTSMSPPPAAPRRTRRWSRSGRLRWALVGLAASAAVFAAALGAVTLVEAVKGAPISGGDSGFSVLGGNGGHGTGTDDRPTSSPATVTHTTTAPATTSASTGPSTTSSAASPRSSSSAPSTTAATTPSTTPPTTASGTTSAAPSTASSTPAPAARAGTAAATTAG